MTKELKNWSYDDWNRKLFKYYFMNVGGSRGKVFRLVTTPEAFLRATDCYDLPPSEVASAFEDVIRSRSRELELAYQNAKSYFPPADADPPEYFLFLVFSCYVACSCLSENAYRKRLAEMLQINAQFQHLNGIRVYWEKLATWLDSHIALGKPYRSLRLPSLRKDLKQIGYAYQLAFPFHRDQKRLAQILRKPRHLNDDRLLGGQLIDMMSNQQDFGKAFLAEFQAFQQAWRHGDAIHRLPFWEVALEIWIQRKLLTVKKWQSIPACLCLRPDLDWHTLGAAILVSTEVTAESTESAMFTLEMDYATDFPFILTQNTRDEDGVSLAFESFLQGQITELLPSLSISETRCMKAGLLLFRYDLNWLSLSSSIGDPEEELVALVRSDMKEHFLRQFPSTASLKETEINGWFLCKSIRLKALQSAKIPSNSPFHGLPYFEKPSNNMQFNGGLRLKGRFVGQPGFFPVIHCISQNEPELRAVSQPQSSPHKHVKLHRRDSYFSLERRRRPLYGTYEIVTHREKANIRFHNPLATANYKEPDEGRWLREVKTAFFNSPKNDGDPAMVPYLSTRSEGNESTHSHAPISLRNRSPKLKARTYSHSSDDVEKLNRFMEVCCRLSEARKGIGESLFIDIMKKIWGNIPQIWSVIRAWVEAGYFEHLTFRFWRSRYFFAIKPRLIIYKTNTCYQARLLGLTPPSLIERLNQLVENHGIEFIHGVSFSPWLPKPITIAAPTKDLLMEIAVKADLNTTFYLEPKAPFLECFLPNYWGELPIGLDKKGLWDWRRCSFSDHAPESDLNLIWYKGERQPDCYGLFQSGECVWWSRSRNWALLTAYRLKDINPLDLADGSAMIEMIPSNVYLPLDLGRQASLFGAFFPGPSVIDDGYCYDFGVAKTAQSIPGQLGFLKDKPDDAVDWVRLKIRILAAIRSTTQLRPLPSPVQTWLKSHPNPHARFLATQHAPFHMVSTFNVMYSNYIKTIQEDL